MRGAVDSVIDDELRKAGLTIDPEARALLKRNLGGDRMATRAEVAKLTLYALGQREISADDVRALTGDVSAASVDLAVDAVLAGDLQAFDTAFSRLALGAQSGLHGIVGDAEAASDPSTDAGGDGAERSECFVGRRLGQAARLFLEETSCRAGAWPLDQPETGPSAWQHCTILFLKPGDVRISRYPCRTRHSSRSRSMQNGANSPAR